MMTRRFWRVAAPAVALTAVALGAWLAWHSPAQPSRLLMAPMMNVIDPCLGAPSRAASAALDPASECDREGGSAAGLIERTLSDLGPRVSPNGRFELGYTLQFPLLRLLREQGSDWVVDQPAVERLVRTLHDVDRPAIVYLFSTHFGVDSPIEKVLMQRHGLGPFEAARLRTQAEEIEATMHRLSEEVQSTEVSQKRENLPMYG